MTYQVTLRCDAVDAAHLEALHTKLLALSLAAIAREAMRIGLRAVGDEPLKLVVQPAPDHQGDRPMKRTTPQPVYRPTITPPMSTPKLPGAVVPKPTQYNVVPGATGPVIVPTPSGGK